MLASNELACIFVVQLKHSLLYLFFHSTGTILYEINIMLYQRKSFIYTEHFVRSNAIFSDFYRKICFCNQ